MSIIALITIAVITLGVLRKVKVGSHQERKVIGVLLLAFLVSVDLSQLVMQMKWGLKELLVLIQWWLTSDQILFRRFLNHQSMFTAFLVAIGFNIWGVIVLYVPVFSISEESVKEVKESVKSKFPRLKEHWNKINGFGDSDKNFVFKSPEERNEIILETVEDYKYEYIALFALSVLPIPFLATILTGGAIFTYKTLKLRYGLFVIFLAKIVKVVGTAAFAYFI